MSTTEIDFKALKAPFPIEAVSWRIGATNKDKTKGIALAYIDARDVMERLDEVCGVENWQVKYSHANGKTIADIGIRINGEWVWKASGAGDTQVEAEKGAISDALKRAAVVWGIGRYLYDLKNVWVEIKPMGRSYAIKNQNDPAFTNALNALSGATNRAKAPVNQKAETEEQKLYRKIQSQLKDSNNLQALEDVWQFHQGNLEKLPQAGQKALYDLYVKKQGEFKSAATQKVEE